MTEFPAKIAVRFAALCVCADRFAALRAQFFQPVIQELIALDPDGIDERIILADIRALLFVAQKVRFLHGVLKGAVQETRFTALCNRFEIQKNRIQRAFGHEPAAIRAFPFKREHLPHIPRNVRKKRHVVLHVLCIVKLIQSEHERQVGLQADIQIERFIVIEPFL